MISHPLKNCIIVCFVLLLLCSCASHTQNTKRDNTLNDKTIWLIDVNATATYTPPLQSALLDQLKLNGPNARIHHIITGDKGNPFFMIKKEAYPDAVLICLGLCGETTKELANYASQANKKGIPVAICYLSDVKQQQLDWNKKYRIPNVSAFELTQRPLNKSDATKVSQQLIPKIIESWDLK